MDETNKKNNRDFYTTFYVENRCVPTMLGKFIERGGTTRESLIAMGLPEDFVMPVAIEETDLERRYVIKQSLQKNYTALMGRAECFGHVISDGDVITFKSENAFVHAIFWDTSKLCPCYKKYRLEKNSQVFLGGESDDDISFGSSEFSVRLEGKTAVISVDASGNANIQKLKNSMPVFVNNRSISSSGLKMFDEINIYGLSVVYLGSYLAVQERAANCLLTPNNSLNLKRVSDNSEKKYFVSVPRILRSLDTEEFTIDAPPVPAREDKTPAAFVLGPSITMSVVMIASLTISVISAVKGGNVSSVIASAIMALGMLAGSLMWPMLMRRYQKSKFKEDEEYRRQRYTAYIESMETKLTKKTDRSVRVLNQTLSPSPDMMCAFLDNDKSRLRLWERSIEDADFLSVRIGMGSRPFNVKIKIPQQGFRLYDDDLNAMPEKLLNKYGMLTNVPLTISLINNRTIGLVGDPHKLHSVTYEMLLSITALHAYDEVKIILLTSDEHYKEFEMFKNVPHIWSSDKKIRFFASNANEVHFVFNYLNEIFNLRDEQRSNNVSVFKPHFVMIVTDPELIEREPLLRYIHDADNKVGLTTIFAYGDITKLPKSCRTIVRCEDQITGFYIKNENANKFTEFRPDNIDDARIRGFVGGLSKLNIKRDAKAMGIANSISFLQMYKAGNINDLEIELHWDNNNSARSLSAPIGVMAGGEVFELDIHEAYHGCHGLVAGTTGSGKSEFLQAFILSLAVNYSPKEVAFVLVDFKGGDMARPFMKKPFSGALPHLSATISNLSGNILYRALVSLDAEIKSRQRIFNKSAENLGVDKLDINSYHKYYKAGRLSEPLPHLIIIIDEFAQLKTQHPEFLAQLINVAQVGRSLGIHLILATQKPSGIVDPQIMSNSRFKVCLKVADKQDSIDMINKADSAYIKNPGRLYLQVGYDEIYECVQSGYSGADYVPASKFVRDDEVTVSMTDNTATPIHSAKIDFSGEKSDKTQLEAIVAELVELGERKNLAVKPLWKEPLSEVLFLSDIPMAGKGLCTATLGMVDLIASQEQPPLVIDFAKTGHIGLYGANGTGKTTFLHTLVSSLVCQYGYTPQELNIYAMDFGGRSLGCLENLPHTGGVIFADEEGKVAELTTLLNSIIDERKRLFAMNNCGTFVDYRAIGKEPLPAVLVIIDNYSSFRDKYMDIADEFTNIIAAGRTLGVYFVITGNTKNGIYYKVTELISSYFVFRMNDPENYFDILGVRPPVTPEEIAGRGITIVDKHVVEFQTALAFEGDTEAERISAMTERFSEINQSWNGYVPQKLSGEGNNSSDTSGVSYSRTIYSTAIADNTPDPIVENEHMLVLGQSCSGAASYGFSLAEDYKLCVCYSDEGSAKKVFGSLLKKVAVYPERSIVFVDGSGGEFESVVSQISQCSYYKGVDGVDELIEALKPELNERLESEEAREKELFIVIGEFNMFFDMITDEQADFMRKIFKYINSPDFGICFVCGFNVNGARCSDRLFMEMITGPRDYIICPNSYDAAAGKIETFPLIKNVKFNSCYAAIDGKSVEIGW